MNQFRKLEVWQKSMNLAQDVYDLTTQFPEIEKYGLINQIRRSAVSIPSNISEGAGRVSKKEFQHFISIASGSASELLTQLLLSERLEFIGNDRMKKLGDEIEHTLNMLYKLYLSLKM